MPMLSAVVGPRPVKLMMLGDSGSGKTGSLISLVEAGYNLRIMDLDQGLDSLTQLVLERCPERMGQIGYMSFRDKIIPGPMGLVVKGTPKAYVQATAALDKWEDGTNPSEWGPDYVFVLDSLTRLGTAAYNWAKGMFPDFKDPRLWYGPAQAGVESMISNLTHEAFKANVIIITHIETRKGTSGGEQGFPTAIGEALGPKLPGYFNTLLLMDVQGNGKNTKRTIKTLPTSFIPSVKNPAPRKVAESYPIDTGLASLFDLLGK